MIYITHFDSSTSAINAGLLKSPQVSLVNTELFNLDCGTDEEVKFVYKNSRLQLVRNEAPSAQKLNIGDVIYSNAVINAGGELESLGTTSGTAVGVCFLPDQHATDGKARFMAMLDLPSKYVWDARALATLEAPFHNLNKSSEEYDYYGFPCIAHVDNTGAGATFPATQALDCLNCGTGYFSYEMTDSAWITTRSASYQYNNAYDTHDYMFCSQQTQTTIDGALMASPFNTDNTKNNVFYQTSLEKQSKTYYNEAALQNGKVLTDWMVSHTDSGETQSFAAANACKNYTSSLSALNGQWYLGSVGEWLAVTSRFETLNSILSAKGGNALAASMSDPYWSSTWWAPGGSLRIHTGIGLVDALNWQMECQIRPFVQIAVSSNFQK